MDAISPPGRTRLIGLIDAAACPDRIHAILQQSGASFQSVYAGLPEEALGQASLFLVPIDDPEADWVTELKQIDLRYPCLSLVWSRLSADDLASHLRAFLFADIGDGVIALVRFFDPRNTRIVFQVWGDQILKMFMGPIERWQFRGRHRDWQRIENNALTGARIRRSIVIEMDQKDIDTLTAHTEPDELLALLTDAGIVNEDCIYQDRIAELMPRYERALKWGLTEVTDRLGFCQYTYLHGAEFDTHPRVAEVLTARRKSGKGFSAAVDTLPSYVWDELAHRRAAQA